MLRHLVVLIYKKAIDEPDWADTYAFLCCKMFCGIDKRVEDHNLLTLDGKYIHGGSIVRMYLLTKWQEDKTQSLAKLLTMVGEKLDEPEAKSYMDAYLVCIQAISVNEHLAPRIRFMLKDSLELRSNGWVPSVADTEPKAGAEPRATTDIHKGTESRMQVSIFATSSLILLLLAFVASTFATAAA
ncbi:hypothetical protein IWW39_004570 [Coemansia spiralis]|uniref:MIF4G domain-containing protein n=1 Tax=Coemansia spiralis TaxID=417178 RepID=A0A9W8GH37_9FUNG|nr:hypothetical protein IWW39_004570 [Coemansia spiralis]